MPSSTRTLVVTDGPHADRLAAISLWRCPHDAMWLTCDDGQVALYRQFQHATTVAELVTVVTGGRR